MQKALTLTWTVTSVSAVWKVCMAIIYSFAAAIKTWLLNLIFVIVKHVVLRDTVLHGVYMTLISAVSVIKIQCLWWSSKYTFAFIISSCAAKSRMVWYSDTGYQLVLVTCHQNECMCVAARMWYWALIDQHEGKRRKPISISKCSWEVSDSWTSNHKSIHFIQRQ